ncbi:hypothetical protein BBJ28_00014614 [Nothophytophthora sp. Chile5]|nr:hypothetical protein BBJ28_00014614 [Nothophytophthora sp. Chile5]
MLLSGSSLEFEVCGAGRWEADEAEQEIEREPGGEGISELWRLPEARVPGAMADLEIFNDINLVLQLNQHIQGISLSSSGARVSSTVVAGLLPSSPPSPTASLAKRTSFKVLTNLEAVSSTDPREDAQFEHQRAIFLSVGTSDLPFHLQGDCEFNEASAMAKRRVLRFSETIKARIQFLWEVASGRKQVEMAQRVRQQQQGEQQEQGRHTVPSVRRAGASNGARAVLPEVEELDEQDYMALMLLIFKVLRDDFVLELAHKQIQCDWEVDSHHGQTLNFDHFFAALFELVDVWTCDVEEATYARFLELLTRRITRRVAVFLDGAELKLALSDNFDAAVVVKAIPLHTVPKFASVAHVVASTGMTTVGELAHASPQVVESSRLDFLQRRSRGGGAAPSDGGDMRKIGHDLQTLLTMFQTIAHQFEHADYYLEDNVLRKLPTAAGGSRPRLVDHAEECQEGSGESGVGARQTKHCNDQIARGGGYNYDALQGVHGPAGAGLDWTAADGASPKTSNLSDYAAQGQAPSSNGGVTSKAERIDWPRVANDAHSVGGGNNVLAEDGGLSIVDQRTSSDAKHAIASRRNGSVAVGKPAGKLRARGGSESTGRSFHPLNTIHDLQIADTDVVDALRSTFLIEKNICIERQMDVAAVRAELRKFGVEAEGSKLSDDAARDRYNALYDLLVLRDGESLKTLAGVMLEQIKLELNAHGITVNDEDAEEMYDGFYASVVAGTGDSIVQDAQRWVEATAQGNAFAEYIQNDFHELKPIDEVALLGTRRGDEEFLALVAKDADGIEEGTENSKRVSGRKNSSPIQRKSSRPTGMSPSEIAVPQNIDATPSQTGPSELEAMANARKERKKTTEATPKHAQGGKDAGSVKEEDSALAGDKKTKGKKRKSGPEKLSAPSSLPSSAHGVNQNPRPVGAQLDATMEDEHGVVTSIDEMAQAAAGAESSSDQHDPNGSHVTALGPPIEAANASIPSSGKQEKPTLATRRAAHLSGLEEEMGTEGNDNHLDISGRELPHDLLRIAIDFEQDDSESNALSARQDEERYVPVAAPGRSLLVFVCALLKVCYDIGNELDTALAKLQSLQRCIGKRVILIGGNEAEPDRTQQVAMECLAQGALYFASVPFNFPRLREKILSYFKNSRQPYILRQRKPPGQAAHMGNSIGPASLFALHDEPRRVSTPVAYAKTPRRKLAVATGSPALPSLTQSPRDSLQPLSLPLQGGETRRAEFTPSAPGTPRSPQSRHKPRRLSAALNKLIR